MKAVAVTGCFGSGKSTVLKFARSMGFPALDADRVVAGLYRGRVARARLVKEFGNANRKKIAKIVFYSQKKRKKLESILHPLVWRKVEKWLGGMRGKGVEIALVEVPLLFEAKWEKRFDAVVVVRASKKKCLARLAAKGVSRKEALARLGAQIPIGKKVKKAHCIIDNGKGPAMARAQMKVFLEALISDG
jgi:dephospho-CoA kinase